MDIHSSRSPSCAVERGTINTYADTKFSDLETVWLYKDFLV